MKTDKIYCPAISTGPVINRSLLKIIETSKKVFEKESDKDFYMRQKVHDLSFQYKQPVYGFEDFQGLNFAVIVNPVNFVIRNFFAKLSLYYILKFRATRADKIKARIVPVGILFVVVSLADFCNTFMFFALNCPAN